MVMPVRVRLSGKLKRFEPGIVRRYDERLAERYFSLNGLDRKLEKYLDFDFGFFVEAGANDGIAQSNTLHFERYRNWRGLLLDPIPALAWRCRAVRPKSLTLNVALGSFEQRGQRIGMTYCNLMSVVDGAMTIEEQNAHVEVGASIQQLEPYRLSATCVPLSDLIDTYGVGRIDLLSLDVEGHEVQVVKGIDFSRHRPRFMLIEVRNRDDMEAVIGPYYEIVEELNERDLLYGARAPLSDGHSVGWRFDARRWTTNLGALARWYYD